MRSVNLNSIWKKLERTGFRFYCVSCHRERLLAVPARAGSFQFNIHVLVTTAFLMLVTWPLFHFKGVVLFIPIWAAFEGFYRMKMRSVLVCPDCDFDPVLYMVDRDQAVQKVEDVWRRKFEKMGHPFPERKRNGQLRCKPVSGQAAGSASESSQNSAENAEGDATSSTQSASSVSGPESRA